MSIYVCGFVEISSLDEADWQTEYAWQSCLDIGSLGLGLGAESEILFGATKHPLEWVPVAQGRGLPAYLGALTARASTEAVEGGTAWGFTWITYEEIAQIDWQAYPHAEVDGRTYGWGLLFRLMHTLDNASKHQRLVVWLESF
ncbi:hypothetical protein [Hymenobacter arizonensis]|uniref:Uncharacterized protein n=1 Tax=Hymenobacter arizonensis TaxID=1227077 RepID=A0A1I6BDH3_HYMAR|nr:hypothetical protein [Hymenobacter arizonensis]SFQ78966.1 hypothetical protein SAMN04515668_4383 [Hymenobacter arizonensis]